MSDIKVWLIIGILRLSALLPLRLVRSIGRGLGKWIWLANDRSRQVTELNIKLCFPELSSSERDRLARASIDHLGVMVLETASAWFWPVDKLFATIDGVVNRHLLDQAVAQGSGVVVLMPHLGNWELMNLYLSSISKTTSLYHPLDPSLLDRLVYRARSRAGGELAPTDTKGVRAVLQALKSGQVVGILPDQEPDKNGGEFSDFFGVPALTMTLVSNLVQRTSAQVLCAFAQQVGSSSFRIVFQPADQAIYSNNMDESLSGLNKTIEDSVYHCPQQYQWEYKRFSRMPDGTKRNYKR